MISRSDMKVRGVKLKISHNQLVGFLALVTVAVSSALCPAQGVEAVTRPNHDVTLAFIRAGLVKEVQVKEGDIVKSGQTVIQLDDAAEQEQLAQLKDQAEDKIRIKAAEAQLLQKQVDLDKFKDAYKKRVATKMELEHARLDVIIAELSLALAKFEAAQYDRQYKEALLRVERMKLTSPIAGKVERVLIEVGESVDELQQIMRIVAVDPLRIDVPVPLSKARSLKVNQAAVVEFPVDRGNTEIGRGKIVSIASEADAASNTLRVRVEVANPTSRPAGEHVKVTFPPARGPK